MSKDNVCLRKINNIILDNFEFILKYIIVDTTNPPKELSALNKRLKKSNINLNLNDVLVMQYSILIVGLIIDLVYTVYSKIFLKTASFKLSILLFILFTVISIAYRKYIVILLNKEDKIKQSCIPIYSNYMLSMYEYQKTTNEIMYLLTTLNTPYQKIFMEAYEKFLLNIDDGIDFLIDEFNDTVLKEVFKQCKDTLYDKTVLINYLNNINNIITKDYINSERIIIEKQFVKLQGFIAVPLLLLSLLGALPAISLIFVLTEKVTTTIL